MKHLAILLIASALAAPGAALAQSKVAVVDSQRAALGCAEGLKAQSTLRKLFDNRQVELDNKQQQLSKEKEAIEKEATGGKVSKDLLQKKMEAWQRQVAEVQNSLVAYQREVKQKEQQLMQPIESAVTAAVARLAKGGGYDLVVERSAAPYFRADFDLTDQVITMLDSGKK